MTDFSTSTPGPAPAAMPPLTRGGALDVLRFFAAAFFVLYHYEQHAPSAFAAIHPGLGRGYLGTDFFLILSGYVLGRTYGPRLKASGITTVGFLIKRLARLWPPYAVVLAALVAMASAAAVLGQAANNPQGFDFAALPGHILLLQAWGLGFTQGWNTPTWTLSALVFCYALFPTLWRLLSRVRGPAVLAVGVAAIAVGDLAARAAGHTYYDIDPGFGILRAVPLFILGVSLARYVPSERLAEARGWLWPLAAAAVIGLQLLGRLDFLSILAIAAMVLFAGARPPARPSALAALGGQLSFALYLTHTLAGIVWYRVLERLVPLDSLTGPVAWLAWASAFPFAVACAWVFHRVVERPLKTWSDRRFEGRPASQPAAARA